MQIAIGYDGKENDASIWCDIKYVTEKGEIVFDVINGGWVGTFYKNNVHVHQVGIAVPSVIVWAGSLKGHYNDVLTEIREIINAPDYVMMPMEEILAYDPRKRENEKYGDDWDDDVPF